MYVLYLSPHRRPFGAQLRPFLEMLSGPNNGGHSVDELHQGGGSSDSTKQ